MTFSRLRFRISHTAFCIGFCAVLFVICNAVNLDRLARWFRVGDTLDLAALLAYLLAALCIFTAFFTLLAHRWTIKPLAILLTLCSGVVTYFIAKYGVAIDSSMIRNALHTDTVEVGQLITVRMIPYLVLLVALPIVVILRADISFEGSGRYLLGSLKIVGIALVIALGSLYAEYQAIFRVGNVSNKYIVYQLVPVNVISGSISVASKALRPYLRRQQKEIPFAARVTTPGNLVVVLAVGESSRRKNFSVYGYSRRETNPQLKQIPGLHMLDAVATRASTLYALPKILEKADIKLTTAVSRAGVTTACYVNYTLYDNCAAVGETKVDHCAHGGKCYDEDVIPLLEKDLGTYQSGYRFLVLHFGGGSHGPIYADRHPPEFQQFKPMCNDADIANQCTLEEVYNSYDNTILYVDHVVSEALRALDRSGVPYVFIYLSDHGESLLENGMMFHGVPPGMSLPAEQAEVPLIVKSSVPVSIVPRAVYQQGDVFDSVLDLFGIEAADFDRAGSFIKRDADHTALTRLGSANEIQPAENALPGSDRLAADPVSFGGDGIAARGVATRDPAARGRAWRRPA